MASSALIGPRRIRSRRRLFVVVLSTATAVGLLPAAAGQAAPKPSITQVQRQIDALSLQADQAVEAYDNAHVQLDAAARKAAAAGARVKSASARLDALQQQMGAFAAAAYRGGGDDQLLALVTSGSPQTFLDQAASLDVLARNQRDELDEVRVAHHDLAQAQSDAAEQLGVQKGIERQLAGEKNKILGALAQQQAVLSHLKADQRRALAAAAAKSAAAERAKARAAEAALAATVGKTVNAVKRLHGSYNGPASGRAGVAVAYAYSQLGKPYQWAADGPGSFDCSGLTMMAWRQAGVSLPHSSQAQYNSGRHVSLDNLQPGDLVFYGSPIHHVSIYVGNGMTITAPHTGSVVKFEGAVRGDTAGAVRP